MNTHTHSKTFATNKITSVFRNRLYNIAASLLLLPCANVAIAQTAPVDEQNDDTEVISVVGVRSSLEAAQQIKRVSNTVVEAITAEDIGQFSDDSIAGALQRMPGIQIERDDAGTDGDRVSIRGLGPEFVNSTINGRRILSSGNEARGLRKMNFNVFPSNILSGVRVAKGQTAARPESGLAGQVNLLTLRPLDMKQLNAKETFGLVSVSGDYNDLAGETGNKVNLFGAWRNEQSDLGAFISLVTGESNTSRDQVNLNYVTSNIRVNNDNVAGEDELITGVSVPNAVTYVPNRSAADRTAISTGIQWLPSDNIEVVWDLTYAEFDNKSQRHNGQFLFGGMWANTVFDESGIEIDENNVLQSADFGQAQLAGAINYRMQDQTFNNVTENLVTGLNLEWVTGKLTSSFDVFMSSVDYKQDLRFPIFQIGADESLVSFDMRSGLPNIGFGSELLSPDAATYIFSIVREIELDADNHGVSLDFSYDLDTEHFSAVEFGVNYDKTSILSIRTAAVQFVPSALSPNPAAEIADAGVTGQILSDELLTSAMIAPRTYQISDFSAVAAIDGRVLTTGVNELGIDPAASHDSEETITALYTQINLDSELADVPVNGNFGVRAVFTENTASAEARVVDTDGNVSLVPITTGGDYWEVLPSLNLNFSLQSDLALRFGVSKTLSRPDYEEIAPIMAITVPEDPTVPGNAVAGNPDLDPMTAWNYDITLEKYTGKKGAFIASIFYKDVRDFIIDQVVLGQTIPGQGDALFNSTIPINFSDGEVKGLELGFYLPLEELLPELEGFGVSANYTYVDSSFDKDVGDAGFGFPGSSKNNYNFMAFYETSLFTARLSYVTRSEFFRTLAGAGSQTATARFTGTTEDLSFNFNVRPTANLSFAFNASNLTDDVRRDYVGAESTFLSVYAAGRSYSLTATYKF
ncbi:TonB-dependent receptor [Aliiglaciecola lipolytica]|uniref:TonB-dependent receptor n=1 Tax=Aliiglaciecola lipolytica TaxID=477689 RepID=UPI001C0A17A7|nr:TonB-dependent receptor [Aliiglaciecola lipolytica]MBU2877904.1 TonB-dependent receptor [Aliiglaciecola lipolytica]